MALATRKKSKAREATAEPSERVQHIMSEASRIFASKGYDGTSMRDIADACGISKALLYHHFESKDEIYAKVAALSTRDLYSFVDSRIPQSGSPSEKIRAFMLATADYFHRHRWAWIASTTAFWSDPDTRRQQHRITRRDRFEKQLRTYIQEAIDAGEIRPVDVAMAGRLILSSLNWMHRWYDPDKPMTPQHIASVYFDMILNGLSVNGR